MLLSVLRQNLAVSVASLTQVQNMWHCWGDLSEIAAIFKNEKKNSANKRSAAFSVF